MNSCCSASSLFASRHALGQGERAGFDQIEERVPRVFAVGLCAISATVLAGERRIARDRLVWPMMTLFQSWPTWRIPVLPARRSFPSPCEFRLAGWIVQAADQPLVRLRRSAADG